MSANVALTRNWMQFWHLMPTLVQLPEFNVPFTRLTTVLIASTTGWARRNPHWCSDSHCCFQRWVVIYCRLLFPSSTALYPTALLRLVSKTKFYFFYYARNRQTLKILAKVGSNFHCQFQSSVRHAIQTWALFSLILPHFSESSSFVTRSTTHLLA